MYRSAVLLALFALVMPALAGAAVTATPLSDKPISGELREWHDDRLVISTAGGDQTIATEQLVALRWSPLSSAADAAAQHDGLIELLDGTKLPASEITVAKGRLSCVVRIGAAEPQTVSIPLARIAAVRLKVLSESAAEQWNETRNQDLASDVLVVLKRGGANVDYVEGVLGDMTSENIEFKLDEESMRIDRAKVAGLIYYRRSAASAAGETRCIVHARNGLQASIANARLEGESLHLVTVEGVELDVPLAEIKFADFSAGKIQYLSDIDQATIRWTPLVSMPAAASLATAYGRPRRDESAFGGPLTLSLRSADDSMPNSVRSFSKGLALRSRTEMTFRLPDGFNRFAAVAGIEPATASIGDVHLTLLGDDRVLYEAHVAGEDPPREIELDIAGIKRLKIVVDFGQNLDTGDWLNLGDARLLK